MMTKSLAHYATALSLVTLLGCGASVPVHVQAPSAPEPQALSEREAIAVIDDFLHGAHLHAAQGWTVDLPRRHGLPIDVRLDKTRIGIEWVSDRDRASYGALLPAPDPSGPLRVVQSLDGALLLVLDSSNYRYEPEGTAALLANQDVVSAKERLRHDLQDFIEYVKSQYAL